MAEANKFVGRVFIEGDSVAKGYGDEEQRLGFAGRLLYRYEGAGAYNWRSEQPEACQSVVVALNGEPNLRLPLVARQFRRHVELGLELPFGNLPQRLLGIFVVNSAISPKTAQDMGGKESIWATWEGAFSRLAADCADLRVDPIIVTAPAPTEHTRFVSGPPDAELHRGLAVVTHAAAQAMGAHHVTFEQIVGYDRLRCLAPDQRHPNALGYDLMAEYLDTLIDERFDIPAAPSV
jgi:hypothetical protein